MKKNIMALLVCLLMGCLVPIIASAATRVLPATWEYPVSEEANITGFEFYNSDNQVVLGNVNKTARAVTITITYDTNSCTSYYMRAVDATIPTEIEYSCNSNIYTWCPPKKKIMAPADFRW